MFIFQHCRLEALNTDNEEYCPQVIAEKLLNRYDCIKISVPSIYFNVDFIGSLSSSPDKINFPNYSFNAEIYYMLKSKKPIDDIINYYHSVKYTTEEIERHFECALHNLTSREQKNQVTISLSGFLKENFRKTRLMHTTNHPNKHVFHYLVNEIYRLIDIPYDHSILFRQDKMVKFGHMFILPCMKRYFKQYGREDDDFVLSEGGKFFTNFNEYIYYLQQFV